MASEAKIRGGPNRQPNVPQIGKEDKDEFHRIWSCKGNWKVKDKATKNADDLSYEADMGKEMPTCCWKRGPGAQGIDKERDNKRKTLRAGAPEWKGGGYFLDGPGGKHTKDNVAGRP